MKNKNNITLRDEKLVKPLKYVVLLIAKELTDDCKSYQELLVKTRFIITYTLFKLRTYVTSFSSAHNLFFNTFLKIVVLFCFSSISIGIFFSKVVPPM